jgi:hypothetical protein
MPHPNRQLRLSLIAAASLYKATQVSTMNHTPMTVRGAEKLRQELDYLKTELRPQIIEAIADAREHGDLKENAEYHAAREQQGFCEGRIQEIEASSPMPRLSISPRLPTMAASSSARP